MRFCILHFAFMPPEYLEGIRLFNAGHYWHAHEQWEQCWLQSGGHDATFYQAIIQAAAALVKWQQGNEKGLSRNWAKSCARLDLLPSDYLGLNLADLRAQIDRVVDGQSDSPPQLVIPSLPDLTSL
jgi:predicted metal-dependent hydrolase